MTTDMTSPAPALTGILDGQPGDLVRSRPCTETLAKAPAPDACTSCPYRIDVPSGVWSEQDYAKLAPYDRETGEQPTALFLCHQNDGDSAQSRMCAGWAACHAQRARTVMGVELLALRIALIVGQISAATYDAAVEHRTRSELFASGSAAAEHGRAEIAHPGDRARAMIAKITRRRTDLQ